MQFSHSNCTRPARIKRRLSRTQVHLEWAKHDLAKITDREIPSWVNGAVYGTVIIVSDTFSNSNTHTHTHTRKTDNRCICVAQFWSFVVPQAIFQCTTAHL